MEGGQGGGEKKCLLPLSNSNRVPISFLSHHYSAFRPIRNKEPRVPRKRRTTLAAGATKIPRLRRLKKQVKGIPKSKWVNQDPGGGTAEDQVWSRTPVETAFWQVKLWSYYFVSRGPGRKDRLSEIKKTIDQHINVPPTTMYWPFRVVLSLQLTQSQDFAENINKSTVQNCLQPLSPFRVT